MAERSDASPTGDPLIAQAEAEADRRRAARAANLFDVRRLIGALFVVYGVILVILGLGESDASIEKSAGVNVNLWAGLGMLVLGLLFLAWAFLRPLSEELGEAEEDDRSVQGAHAPVGPDAAALGGSETTSRRPRGDRDRTRGEPGPGR
jgi:hypothetical protein